MLSEQPGAPPPTDQGRPPAQNRTAGRRVSRATIQQTYEHCKARDPEEVARLWAALAPPDPEASPRSTGAGSSDGLDKVDGTPLLKEPLTDAHLEWPDRVRIKSTATSRGVRGTVAQKTAQPGGAPQRPAAGWPARATDQHPTSGMTDSPGNTWARRGRKESL